MSGSGMHDHIAKSLHFQELEASLLKLHAPTV
jgi:hypothetical protein